jgi:peptide/nickel transport system permease protein
MSAFVVRRVFQLLPLLLGISFLTFAIINFVPGSPLARQQINPRMKAEDIVRIQENLGLNEPWPKRYVIWLGNFAHGDLGLSLINQTPVRDRILNVLPNTLLLSGLAFFLALAISVPIGVVSALKRNSLFDNATTVSTVAAFAIPSVWLGLLLLILFSVKFREWGLPYLPVGGMRNMRGDSGFVDRVQHLILPTVSLALVQLAVWTRYIRSSMLEVIRQDFVRTAMAKGLKDRSVYMGHAFRNALLPLITLLGLSVPDLLAGSLVVETIFGWNGMGRLTIASTQQSDYTMIMGTTIIFALLTILGNLFADVAYALFDPRIRYD